MTALGIFPFWILFLTAPFIYNVFSIKLTNTIAIGYAVLIRLVFLFPLLLFLAYFTKQERKNIDLQPSLKSFLNSTNLGNLTKFSDLVFLPISRLSFSFLMVHFLVIWWGVLQSRFLFHFTYFYIVSILLRFCKIY